MKRLMLVAGGPWQCSIARKAKEMGYHLICSNLYPDSPAFRYADEAFVADVLDYEKNLEIANACRPDAIITDQSDIAVRTVARLNETLGLPGIGSEIAQRFSNKYRMRTFCGEHHIDGPAFIKCQKAEDAIDFLQTYKKIIIKPLDSQSSRGVFVVENRETLKRLFEAARNCSICEKAVLAEEFIGGIEFTVDGIKTEKNAATLAISEKHHYREYPNVASQLFFTWTHPRFDYEELCRINNRLIETMELPFGLTHAEYKFYNGRFYLIEIAARGGGTNISSMIVPYMSGVDSNGLLIRMASGEKVGRVENGFRDGRACCLGFFSFPEGIAEAILNENLLKNDPRVLEYRFNFSPGGRVPSPVDDSKRPGHFIATASSSAELSRWCAEIGEQVKIAYHLQ